MVKKIGLSYTIVFLYLRLSVLHNIMFANLTKNMISSKFFFIKRFFSSVFCVLCLDFFLYFNMFHADTNPISA